MRSSPTTADAREDADSPADKLGQASYVCSVGFRESGFQAVVARASRPCVACTIRTGGTPVPLRWKRRGRRNFVCLSTCRACEWLNTYQASRLFFELLFPKIFGAGVRDTFKGAVSSSPRDAGVGRGPRRGASNVPPLPGPLLHPMEEREFVRFQLGCPAPWSDPGQAGVSVCRAAAVPGRSRFGRFRAVRFLKHHVVSRVSAPEDGRTPPNTYQPEA